MRIEIPKNCPSCDYPLVMVNDQLFCKNTACTARVDKQIEHFAKTLGIKGLGAKTIEKLELADITELYYLDSEQISVALSSEKMAEKLLSEINNSRSAGLQLVLASFGIPLIGNTAAAKLCTVVNDIDEITPETCSRAGLGEKATHNLMSWLNEEFKELREFLPFSFKTENRSSTSSTEKSVCITGKLVSFKNKADAYEVLRNAGFKVVESVTKTTDYLVDEGDRQSSKREKADAIGITIITNLINFIEENKHD